VPKLVEGDFLHLFVYITFHVRLVLYIV